MHRSRKDIGMLLNLYNDIKDCIPLQQTYLSNYIDRKLVKTINKIDQIVVIAKDFKKTIVKSIPNYNRIKEKAYNNIRRRLIDINGRLGMFIWCFQKKGYEGEIEEEKKGRGMSMLELSIEMTKKYIRLSSLIGKECLVKLKGYLTEPNSLFIDIKQLCQQIEIRAIALHKTIAIVGEQLLKYLGDFVKLKYCQVRKQIRLTFFHLKYRRSILKTLGLKLKNGIKITIKSFKKGFRLIFYRDQYAQNQSNFISNLVHIVGKMIRRAQQKWSTCVQDSKQLYQNMIKNYKIQKLLLRNERMKTIQKQKIKSKSKSFSSKSNRNPLIENQEDQYLTQVIQKINQEKDYK